MVFGKDPLSSPKQIRYTLTLTNTGAAHYLPTGTPDRHLTVSLRLIGQDERLLKEENHTLKRFVLWRPFIIDLRDTRLPRGKERSYSITFSSRQKDTPQAVEAIVRYHLLDEKRRQRIGYENTEPISYKVFSRRLPLDMIE